MCWRKTKTDQRTRRRRRRRKQSVCQVGQCRVWCWYPCWVIFQYETVEACDGNCCRSLNRRLLVVLFCINCIVPRISCNFWYVAFCGTVMSEYFLSVHSCRGSRAAAGTVLWLCEWLLVSSADSYNITSYDCCAKMHTIAKVRKTIVTGIKIIARPGEIIANICKTCFVFFIICFCSGAMRVQAWLGNNSPYSPATARK